MRTITLELLRHGPAHNQLLSPLTPYLALCENHGAVTLNVPFEHNQLLHRLSSLSYQSSDEARIFQLQDTARVMGDILSAIPGLTAESNKEGEEGGEHLTHLRLILSASELALLPFELALSPSGVPGSGQHLLLQPQTPICMTREVRRVPGERFRWPPKPRILFAAAAPPKVGTIPLESHLQVLRRLIAPWVKYYPTAASGEMSQAKVDELRKKQVEDHLHFLPFASIDAIEEACSSGNFTHVHILAHGVEQKESYGTRFVLALHNARNSDEVDYVSGPRLATALRTAQKPDGRDLSRPAVVTLASCDSGNVGSVAVAGAGASIAHALHEAGIPMVVAGQFPLSFEGSVRLVEVLYEGLLWGTDPRRLLYDLRRKLYSQFRNTHDWASLTAYVSLPEDFDQQLPGVQIERAMGCIDAAMNHADELLSQVSEKIKPKSSLPANQQEQSNQIKSVREKINGAKKRLEKLSADIPAERARILGNLASTEKREAQFLHSFALRNLLPDAQTADSEKATLREVFELLRKSRDHYWQAFLLDRGSGWAAVQYLSLTLLMKNTKVGDFFALKEENGQADEPSARDLDALWSMSRLLSSNDLSHESRQVRAWAHSSLTELYLLSLMIDAPNSRFEQGKAEKWALKHTEDLIETAGWGSFEVYSAWRQILRYVEWFSKISDLGPATGLAEQIFNRFPEGVEEKWK
jgi:hypothetical protein